MISLKIPHNLLWIGEMLNTVYLNIKMGFKNSNINSFSVRLNTLAMLLLPCYLKHHKAFLLVHLHIFS